MKTLTYLAAALAIPLGFAAAPASAATAAAPRHYDCSKAGNANKAVCKGVAPAAAPASRAAPATAAASGKRVMHYDCSKPGNANKTACRGSAMAPAAPTPTSAPRMAPAPRTASPAPAPRMAPAPRATPAAVGQNTHAGGPNGATARCRDNTYSSSAHRSGTCSRHGGVAEWY